MKKTLYSLILAGSVAAFGCGGPPEENVDDTVTKAASSKFETSDAGPTQTTAAMGAMEIKPTTDTP